MASSRLWQQDELMISYHACPNCVIGVYIISLAMLFHVGRQTFLCHVQASDSLVCPCLTYLDQVLRNCLWPALKASGLKIFHDCFWYILGRLSDRFPCGCYNCMACYSSSTLPQNWTSADSCHMLQIYWQVPFQYVSAHWTMYCFCLMRFLLSMIWHSCLIWSIWFCWL